VYYGRYKVIPIRTEIIKFCETLGFDYMGAIIWQKVTTCNTTGGATIMGSYPYPRNGILKIDYEFILVFKKLGKAPKVTKQQKKQSKISKKDWNMYFSGHWQFPGASQTEHLAVFPEELPARLIKMFSFVEETVLDPFLGSGTTSLAARNLGRNSVGYEINPDYIPIIKDKLAVHQQDLTGTEYEFLKDTSELRSRFLREEIGKLPYIFTDPHKFDKKVDPKKMQFGSQITGNEMRSKENFFSVKDVLSPTLLRLDNDLVVRLLGVREKETTYDRAVEFLRKKTKSEKVFLKYDRQKYDGDNHLLCYLYLKNKTFINARIIKEGLADVDVSYDFKYKDKLIKLGDRNGKRVDFK
jgi:site-specific DNA-methyltransferase (adenine-specific)